MDIKVYAAKITNARSKQKCTRQQQLKLHSYTWFSLHEVGTHRLDSHRLNNQSAAAHLECRREKACWTTQWQALEMNQTLKSHNCQVLVPVHSTPIIKSHFIIWLKTTPTM